MSESRWLWACRQKTAPLRLRLLTRVVSRDSGRALITRPPQPDENAWEWIAPSPKSTAKDEDRSVPSTSVDFSAIFVFLVAVLKGSIAPASLKKEHSRRRW